jgi:hypothetical protein
MTNCQLFKKGCGLMGLDGAASNITNILVILCQLHERYQLYSHLSSV